MIHPYNPFHAIILFLFLFLFSFPYNPIYFLFHTNIYILYFHYPLPCSLIFFFCSHEYHVYTNLIPCSRVGTVHVGRPFCFSFSFFFSFSLFSLVLFCSFLFTSLFGASHCLSARFLPMDVYAYAQRASMVLYKPLYV